MIELCAARSRDLEIITVARRLPELGLVTGTVGNVSARNANGMRITPTRVRYQTLRRRDLVTVDASGVVVGSGTPSRETPLHTAVYAARPDVGGVVHTHSPHAVAWTFLARPLEPQVEELAYYDIGRIGIAAHAPAGSEALAAATLDALGSARAVLLSRHGVLATGSTPTDALMVAEAVEHQARVAWLLAVGEGSGRVRGSPVQLANVRSLG